MSITMHFHWKSRPKDPLVLRMCALIIAFAAIASRLGIDLGHWQSSGTTVDADKGTQTSFRGRTGHGLLPSAATQTGL